MIESAPEERALEAALRPKVLGDFVGQEKVVKQISLVIKAAKLGGRTADHILLAGPPGLGKTTLAMIVAHEAERTLKLTSGPAIQSSGDLASILSALEAVTFCLSMKFTACQEVRRRCCIWRWKIFELT